MAFSGSSPPFSSLSGSPSVGAGAATQLDFASAMRDFRTMFPSMDADVIEAVLRANNGAVDVTVDHLLAMCHDEEQHQVENRADEVPPSYPPQNPPSYQQATEKDLINLGQDDDDDPFLSDLGAAGGSASAAASVGVTEEKTDLLGADLTTEPRHAYSHPMREEEDAKSIVPTQQMLQNRYEENLRRREEARAHPGGCSTSQTQYLEDERLALMMQNDEFMQELRRDTEFMSALATEQDQVDHEARPVSNIHEFKGKGASMHMDEALFREKLKTMGKTSKRKFAQLASMFSRRRSAKQLLGHAPGPSKDNLLLNDEPLVDKEFQYREDDSDDEDHKNTPTKGKYTSFS